MPKASAALWDVARRRAGARPAGRPAHRRRRGVGPAAGRLDDHQGAEPVPAHRGPRRDAQTTGRGRTPRSRCRRRSSTTTATSTTASRAGCSSTSTRRSTGPPPSASPASCRSAATSSARTGPSRRRAGSAVRRRRRRAAPERGAAARPSRDARRRAARDRRARQRPHVVAAVGETGLDHFRTGPDGRAAQEQSFREHIRLAHEHDRTLVIHDRDAHDDVLRVLDEEGVPPRTVMHCFSGDADFARGLRRAGRLPVVRRHRDVQERRERRGTALRSDAAGPDPGRDRCAVPHTRAVSRPSERVLPGSADSSIYGWNSGGFCRGFVSRHRRKYRTCVRWIMARVGLTSD